MMEKKRGRQKEEKEKSSVGTLEWGIVVLL
jgi:hypothetical protein